jgi:hypothetical protein
MNLKQQIANELAKQVALFFEPDENGKFVYHSEDRTYSETTTILKTTFLF